MEIKTPKKLLVLVGTLFLSAALFAALFLYSVGTGAHGGVFLPSPLKAEVYFEGELLFSPKKTLPLNVGEIALALQNKEKEEATFTFFSEGDTLGQITLSAGEEKEYCLTLPKDDLSLVVSTPTQSDAYLCHTASAKEIAPILSTQADLYAFDSVDLSGLCFSCPVRLFGDFVLDELSLQSDAKGEIVLCPNEPMEGSLFVQAPQCKVYFRNFSLPAELSPDFCLKGKSLNGKALNPDLFPVSSFDQLARLATPEAIPNLSENSTLSVTAPISLQEDLVFSSHINLVLDQPLDCNGHSVIFRAQGEGNFSVKSAIGTLPDATALVFDAPDSNLTWESLGTVPALSTIEKYHNVKSYNASPVTLGGKGEAIPSVFLSAEENTFLEEDTVFSAKGNLLTATLPYLATPADLDSAKYILSCQGGSARVEGNLSDGVVIATDEKGNERRFAIEIVRHKENIPVLYLETENGAIVESKSIYLSATFALDGENTEIPSLNETHIRLRGRGNSTWKWDKKPYKIHFDEPTSILGLPAAEEWALFANYADKSLMRNGLAQEMASVLSFDYCPAQVYVDLFLNGEYLGVYTLGEHLEEGEGRIEVIHDMAQRDCGYFIEAGGVVSGVDVKGMNYFHAGLVKFALIKGPEYNALTSEQFEYIKKYMQEADKAVKSGEGYEEYLDLETLIDWLIMIELSNNTDCAWRRSTYFTKNPGEKVKMGPVWDFDLAFGNFSKDVAGFDVWVSTSEDDYVGETWSTHLFKDPEFQKAFKARWEEVKDKLLETARAYTDQTYEMLYPSAEHNFDRWDILGKKVAFERHDTKYYKTYTSQIMYLQDFVEERAAWISQQVAGW